ncbi:ABC transporter substrate-binding protein [Niallia sp. XMNu-256]|uniref:ABC transporter substrate-binding protein n=1 Tax=Niallia sp. XMNu-256 TaxID=3082444 RepID=UPI0030CE6663
MKKLYALLFTFLLSIGILVGCGTGNEAETNEGKQESQQDQQEQTKTSEFPVTIKDALDQEIVIEKKPERIISLIPSNTEIAFELGLGDEIIGVSNFDNYPEEAAKKEKIGDQTLNLEKIFSLKPDLILSHHSAMGVSSEVIQQLKDAGITVLTVNDAKTFTEVYDSIELIGKSTGTSEEAEQLVSDMQTKLEEIQGKTADIKEKKKVYVEIDPTLFAAGKNTFIDEMLTLINAENMVTEPDWPQLDQEAIIAANPDVIITTYGGYIEGAGDQVLSREGWQDINAIKNKQVVDVDSDKVTRPGPRIVEGVEELAKAIYPEVFN